ncbi:hypothetical protein CHUAL_013175 [Chamberlinius hualienensis]
MNNLQWTCQMWPRAFFYYQNLSKNTRIVIQSLQLTPWLIGLPALENYRQSCQFFPYQTEFRSLKRSF